MKALVFKAENKGFSFVLIVPRLYRNLLKSGEIRRNLEKSEILSKILSRYAAVMQQGV